MDLKETEPPHVVPPTRPHDPSMTEPTLRAIADVVTAHRQLEGGGFPVRRPFPTMGRELVDPFLLLDEMGPVDWPPGEAIGAPDHPHRGFETVTYVLEGKVVHRDSHGHAAVLGPGGAQWMTAGSGVVHSEMPEEAFLREGGRMHGFQIWVNLPKADKMMTPRYQDLPREAMPTARSEDGRALVRVIAGESMGASAAIDTRIPITYLHFTLQPGGRIVQLVPSEQTCFVYLFGGRGRFGPEGRDAASGQMVVFGDEGDAVDIACPDDADEPLELLLLGGQPLGEPVARYGPFVMNTPQEIKQAIEDYRAGRFGEIAPTGG